MGQINPIINFHFINFLKCEYFGFDFNHCTAIKETNTKNKCTENFTFKFKRHTLSPFLSLSLFHFSQYSMVVGVGR